MKLGIIGAGGYWGQKILRITAELDGVDLECCSAYSNSARLELLIGEILPENRRPSVARSRTELMQNREIESLIVASPAETHYPIVREALLNEKHVFVEKPMCLSSAEAGELVRLAREQERVLFVNHTYVHSKCLEYMRSRVEEGFLGDPIFLHSNRTQIGIYREHNVLWDLAPHDLSIVYFLFPDARVDRVSLQPWSHFPSGDTVHSSAMWDAAHYTIHFGSGFKASGFLSWCHPKWARDISLVGTEGMLLFEGNTTVKSVRSRSPGSLQPNRDDWELREEFAPQDNPLRNALTAFLDLAERPDGDPPRHLRPEFASRIIATIENLERSHAAAVLIDGT